MKEQFTQGDWSFQANDSYIELHAGGKMIGDLCMGLNTCTEAELKANARLFKVAPKMFKTLSEISTMLLFKDKTQEQKDLKEHIDLLLAEVRVENNEHSD